MEYSKTRKIKIGGRRGRASKAARASRSGGPQQSRRGGPQQQQTRRSMGQRARGAISSAARGARALGRGASAMGTRAARGARSVGSRAAQGARAVGSRAAQGARAVGSRAAQGARAVGSRAARGARAVGSRAAQGARAVGRGARSAVGALGRGARSAVGAVGSLAGVGAQLAGPLLQGGPGNYGNGGPGNYGNGGPGNYGNGGPGDYGNGGPGDYGNGGPGDYGNGGPGDYGNGGPNNGGPNSRENSNGNGIPNSRENSNGDGIPNSKENTNGDGIPNSQDPNSPSYQGSRGQSRRITSVSPSVIEGEVVPGVPIDLTPDEYNGPMKPGVYKIPFEKNAKTGFLQTVFMTRSPEGYKYYKIYGTSVPTLETNIKNFITFVKSTNSPSGKFVTTLDGTISDLKQEIEEEKTKFDKLEKQFDFLDPNDKENGAQIMALIQNRINNLIEELDGALRIKELAKD